MCGGMAAEERVGVGGREEGGGGTGVSFILSRRNLVSCAIIKWHPFPNAGDVYNGYHSSEFS